MSRSKVTVDGVDTDSREHGGGIDLKEAQEFLDERYGGRAQDVSELGGGDWSRAFSFDVDGAPLVARFGRYQEDYLKDEWAMTFAGPDLPVPRVVEVGDAFGGAHALSERHTGCFLETLDGSSLHRLMPALLRALDALRLLPVPPGAGCCWRPDGSTDPTGWREWLLGGLVDSPGERVSGWRARLAEMPDIDALFVAGEQALNVVLDACPEVRHVLHLDLLNRNVLVAEDGTSLEAIFDWGCLSYGDFLYEVAWFTFWAPWHAGLAAIDMRAVIRDHLSAVAVDVPSFDERLRCYELHIGLTHLAYCAFVQREADLGAVAGRLRQVMESSWIPGSPSVIASTPEAAP
jgi:hygromycin-B 4-O-kinase